MNLRMFLARVAGALGAGRDDRDLSEELEFHLDQATRAHVARGLAPDEARRTARREMGGLDGVAEAVRDQRGLPWLDLLRQDVRYALRGLRRDRRFTVVTVTTLAVGVGATTAVFSLLSGVILDPLPYPEPSRLVRVFESSQRFPAFPVSPANFVDYRRETRTLAALAAYSREDLQLAENDRPERLRALRVSTDYFALLGTEPALGRGFLESEQREDARVVILSHDLWLRRFGANPAIVGSTVRLNGLPFTIVGVMPAGFQHVGGSYRSLPHGETVDAWWPLELQDVEERRGWHNLNVVGRLEDGVGAGAAQDELLGIVRSLAARYPAAEGWGIRVVALQEEIVGGTRSGVWLLMAAAATVMLIVCVNVAGLLLARATARQREIAVRFALGASRRRLLRQALTEAAVLMAPGAIGGVVLAFGAVAVLTAILPADFPRLHNVRVDAGVLGFGLFVSAVAVFVFGLSPALQMSGTEAQPGLHEGGNRASASRQAVRLRGLLVASEVALASTLLVGAGLLLRSFVALQHVDAGFHAGDVMTASLMLPPARYQDPAETAGFYQRLVERVTALPGVEHAGGATALPWTGWDENTGFGVPGLSVGEDGRSPNARFNAATPGYFEALGIPLRRGRLFDTRDATDATPVVVVNEALVRRYLKGADPIGNRLDIWGAERTIVGVVGDVRDAPADAAAVPAFWWPHAQQPFMPMALAVLAARPPASIVADVRTVLRDLDPDVPLADVRPMGDVVADALAARRFLLFVTVSFAATALLLAAIGAYGVLAWSVEQRSRELGIRLALGARASSILGLVVAQGLRLTAAGLAAGLAVALVGAGAMASLLYGVSPRDGVTYGVAAATILIVAAGASLGPGIRAMRANPTRILRLE